MTAEITRRPLKSRGRPWAAACARWAMALGLRPNQISVLSLVFAGLAAVALWLTRASEAGWRPWLFVGAAAGIQLRLLCNMLDGMVAIEGGCRSKTGEVYNELPDRYADIFILLAAGYAWPQETRMPTLGWMATVLAVLTAYVRALGGALGLKQDFCGPMAKPHRMFTLTVGCLGEAVCAWFHIAFAPLLWALILVCAGSVITVQRRTSRLVAELRTR